MMNFITSILGEYLPCVTDRGGMYLSVTVNYGWIFDAVAILLFSVAIFKVISMIVKGVFYRDR